MSTYSDTQLAQLLSAQGFGGSAFQVGFAIVLAESGGNSNARNVNSDGSVDRGLWQINNLYHAEVSDSCAYDPVCATQQAKRISANGTNWYPWSTFNNQSYKRYLSRAQAAQAQLVAGVTSAAQGTNAYATSGVSLNNAFVGSQLPGATAYTTTTVPVGTDTGTQAFWRPYQVIVAFIVLFGFLYALTRFAWGYTAAYYGEVLILLFLFATQAQFFRESMLPWLGKQPRGT